MSGYHRDGLPTLAEVRAVVDRILTDLPNAKPAVPYDGPLPDDSVSPHDEDYYAAIAEDREFGRRYER